MSRKICNFANRLLIQSVYPMAQLQKPLNLSIEDGQTPTIRLRAISTEEKAFARTSTYEYILP